ncbi:MAG TPA: GNAT family N-acetyltransferase [Longimicrobiales bacterium]|nr:GNAT family N-acetyltransferase [Longimicrobiales bacterium]
MSEQREESRIIRIPGTDAADVVGVLWESFFDYPVMRHVLRDSGLDYAQHLQQLIGLFVSARALRDDVMLGIKLGGELVGVVTTSNPMDPPHPDFAPLREQLWQALGPEASARYQQYVTAWDSMATHEPQLHVNMIGVRRAFQRSGLARQLLSEVHEMAKRSPSVTGVSLTTEDERNVPLYQRHGYQVIGEKQIAPGLKTWSFFRPNA